VSRKLTSKCDGCGVEVVEGDDPGMGMVGLRRRRSSERWGNLTVATSAFPAHFDLCEACTKRVIDLLELEIPKPEAMMRHLGGLGGHAMPFMPGDFMAPPSAPPWGTPGPAGVPFGGLTPEDLKALGIEIPGFMQTPTPRSTCASCGVAYKGPAKGVCSMCGHVND
jgi:hypothetical protein